MTERLTVDTITSDQLDALYDRIATLEAVAAGNKRHAQLIVLELENCDAARRALRGRLERAEAAIARVRALHQSQPDGSGFPDSQQCRTCSQDGGDGYQYLMPYPCPTARALDEPKEQRPAKPCCGRTIGHLPGCHVNQGLTDRQPEDKQEQGAPVDWQAIAKQRERELKTVGAARHTAENRVKDALVVIREWQRDGEPNDYLTRVHKALAPPVSGVSQPTRAVLGTPEQP